MNGQESAASDFTTAQYNGLTDDQLMDFAQQGAFQYFWAGGHPFCGMAREGIGLGHPLDTVTIGGTGFGLMSIVVGSERSWVTRAQAADRTRRILRFLDGVRPDNSALPSGVQRYHGAWAHHYNGNTGATIPFAGAADNGADLVETAFLISGMLTARQYFDHPTDPVEAEIRSRATSMWHAVEWSWFRRTANNTFLYWHWSPNFGWQMNLPIRGFNETQIIYLLAIASPTFPVPASLYHTGYAGLPGYVNGNFYFGLQQFVGEPLGGPLFFTHYSNVGFDPRYKRDQFCNYFENHRNISLINRAYCIENPLGWELYNPLNWGLTASNNPTGYSAQSPTNDNGTISPTAALSAMAYVPQESLATLRYWYDNFGGDVFGIYGAVDAFNFSADWVAPGWLAIDQGPIVVMIENHRSELCWRLFMSNPEIAPMMNAVAMRYEIDFDLDGDVDATDMAIALTAMAGPGVTTGPPGVTPAQFADSDLDNDGDVDMHDAAIGQQLVR
ncbi:MAG: glucoamylase family protein [Phycisphaerae bacterium]